MPYVVEEEYLAQFPGARGTGTAPPGFVSLSKKKLYDALGTAIDSAKRRKRNKGTVKVEVVYIPNRSDQLVRTIWSWTADRPEDVATDLFNYLRKEQR